VTHRVWAQGRARRIAWGRARRIAWRPVRPNGWWLDALMVVGFVVVTAALAWPPVRDLDLAVRDLADAHRPHAADIAAQSVNRLGSGGILVGVSTVMALLLMWRVRSAWPLAPVAAAFLLTAVVIQPLKLLFHRAAPHSPLPDDVEVRLFGQPEGLSYPSGHAVNTIVWYGVLSLLLAAWLGTPAPDRTRPLTPDWLRSVTPDWLRPAAWRWLRFAVPIVVGFTATYLSYHWFTDMVAGLCIGVLIDRIIARTPWPRIGTSGRSGVGPD
jgi:membrane-associated phospholipid phosphatase